jgi:hypothetical protein
LEVGVRKLSGRQQVISGLIISVLILNGIILFFNFSEDNVGASFTGKDATPPTTGDWVIDSGGNIVTNEKIILNEYLYVRNGGSLIFQNVTLLMNCIKNGTYNIEVDPGGEFLIMMKALLQNGQVDHHLYKQVTLL